MKLLQILSIASASAITFQNPHLCSAAVKSLEVQELPPKQGQVVANTEYTKQESAALYQYQCSKDSSCSSVGSKGFNDPESKPNITDIKERMGRNQSSVEVFSWGFRLYVPSVVRERADSDFDKSCGALFDGPIDYCYNLLKDSSNFPKWYASMLMCSVLIGPWSVCISIREALFSLDQEGGAIVSATWQTITKPTTAMV